MRTIEHEPSLDEIFNYSPSIGQIVESLNEYIEDGNAMCLEGGLWTTQLCQHRDRRTYDELLIHFIKEYYYEYI